MMQSLVSIIILSFVGIFLFSIYVNNEISFVSEYEFDSDPASLSEQEVKHERDEPKSEYTHASLNSSNKKLNPAEAEKQENLEKEADKEKPQVSITRDKLQLQEDESSTYTTKPSATESASEKITELVTEHEALDLGKTVIAEEEMSMLEIHERIMNRWGEINEEKELKKLYPLEDFESHKNKERINLLFWFAAPRLDDRRQEFRERFLGPKNREYCGDCFLTGNRRWKEKSDGIIFSNGKLLSWQITGHYPSEHNYEKPYPPWPDLEERDPNQWWVFYNRESAVKSINQQPFLFRKKSSEIESAFNGTMNYRRDSDFVKSFGDGARANIHRWFANGTKKGTDENYLQRILDEKKLLKEDVVAAWFVSDCDHTIGAKMRWDYGKKLIDAGIRIHGEGECFDKVTDKKFSNMAKADFNLEHVKFYLAFENAYHCDDYISEKFWRNALTNRAVPIVFGPSIADVDEIAPPQSYIHAEWFSSPELLVKYVHWLADNDKQYLDYHRWRNISPDRLKHPAEVRLSNRPEDFALCDLCRKIRINREAGLRQFYKSIMKWWSLDSSPECQMGTKYPEYLYKIENNKVIEKMTVDES